jgi:hypothetical protein
MSAKQKLAAVVESPWRRDRLRVVWSIAAGFPRSAGTETLADLASSLSEHIHEQGRRESHTCSGGRNETMGSQGWTYGVHKNRYVAQALIATEIPKSTFSIQGHPGGPDSSRIMNIQGSNTVA